MDTMSDAASELTTPDPGTADPAPQPIIAVLGGTGDQGLGLAYRWARAGLPVLIGSRQAERAADAAAQVGFGVRGGTNAEVAAQCDIALVAVPCVATSPRTLRTTSSAIWRENWRARS